VVHSNGGLKKTNLAEKKRKRDSEKGFGQGNAADPDLLASLRKTVDR
jgi:hypothetical protein